MKLDVVGLNLLTPDQRRRFKSISSQIVAESFVFTADRDYLTARFAFFEKQTHLFLWSAAQAVEKYLKANVLLLGIGSIKKSHKLMGMLKSLRAIKPERLAIDTSIPARWTEQGIAYWPSGNIDNFIAHLETWGSPGVRYDQNGFSLNLQHLVLLDRLVFGLRENLVEEQISECRHAGQRLLNCFYDLNFSFAPKDYQHPSLKGLTLISSSVSSLEAALKGVYGLPALYERWAKQSLGLNEYDISFIKSISGSTSSTKEVSESGDD